MGGQIPFPHFAAALGKHAAALPLPIRHIGKFLRAKHGDHGIGDHIQRRYIGNHAFHEHARNAGRTKGVFFAAGYNENGQHGKEHAGNDAADGQVLHHAHLQKIGKHREKQR